MCDAALSRATPFEAEFQEMVTEYCWGGTWGRERHGPASGAASSILACSRPLGRMHEFELHFRGGFS